MFARVHSLLVILLLAPLAWGQKTSLDFHSLAYQDKWLKLNHFEKSLWGYSSPFDRGLFLSPQGSHDPEAELRATWDAFVSPSQDQIDSLKMPPQCFYRARLRFLKPYLLTEKIPLVPCPKREEWKKLLNAKGLSLIFAASDLGSATSSFGHLFLKLRNPDNVGSKELLDYGMNYAADANSAEGVFYAMKGLLGFYDGRFTMLPFHQKIREYTNMEGRDLWEYQLDFTPDEVDELVDHLLEMEKARAPYYFFTDNCAYQIVRTLDAIRPSLHLSDHLSYDVIPLDALKSIARTPRLVRKTKFTKSLKSAYLEDYRKLNSPQRVALADTKETLQVPSDLNFTPKETGEILETAMKFFALKAYQTGRDFDQEKYKLSTARARLGAVTKAHEDLDPDPPDKAHDSRAIYLGGGDSFPSGPFQSLKFRVAFHDLDQPDLGMVAFSHIEMISLEARRYNQNNRFTLHQFTIFNLLNTSPITALDNYISWRARFAVRDNWQTDFIGGAGVSYNIFPWLHWTQIINLRYLDPFLGVGPNFVLATRVTERLGASLDAGYYFGDSGSTLWELTARASLQLRRNLDLQIEYGLHADTMARVVFNFL